MTPQVISLSAAGSTAWIPVDYKQNPYNIDIAVVLSNTPNLTYKVEYTLDDVFNTAVTPTAFTHSTLIALTANSTGTIKSPVRAIRLTITSWTSGTATMTALQGVVNPTLFNLNGDLETELDNHRAEHAEIGVLSTSASIAGLQREVRGQNYWVPGDTIYDGGGGIGTGAIAVSSLPDFTGWKVTLDPGTTNSKINAQKDIAGSVALASTDVIWVRFYVPSWSVGMGATVYISSVTNWSKFVFGGWSNNQLQEGWNELPLLASSMTASGGEVFPFTPLRVRVQVQNNSGAGGDLYIGNIRIATGMPMATLCIDDCYSDMMRYAYPILAKNNLSASVFVVTDWQDQQDADAMADNTVCTWRDLQLLDDRGWDICAHPRGHQNALSYAEVGTIAGGATAAVFSGIGTSGDNVINFVGGPGLTFDKPRGLSLWSAGNETNKLCTIVGTTSAGPVTEKLQMRNATFAISLNEWTTVTSVTMGSASAAKVTLRCAYNSADYSASANYARDRIIANGMPRAASWFAWARGEWNKPIRDLLIADGFSFRGTFETQTGNILTGGLIREFPSYSAGETRTLGDIQTFIGLVQARSSICSLFWHHINPNGATPINTLPSVFTTEVEWLAAQVYAGALRCPTFTQLSESWVN